MIHTASHHHTALLNRRTVALLGICPFFAGSTSGASATLLAGALIVSFLFAGLIVLSVRSFILPSLMVLALVGASVGAVLSYGMIASVWFPQLVDSVRLWLMVVPAALPILALARVQSAEAPQKSITQCTRAFVPMITVALLLFLIGLVREALGQGSLFGHVLSTRPVLPWILSIPGALMTAAAVTGLAASVFILRDRFAAKAEGV